VRETKQPVSQSAQRLFAHRFEPAIAIECFGTRVDVDDRELDRTFALLACKFQDAVQLTGSDALAATFGSDGDTVHHEHIVGFLAVQQDQQGKAPKRTGPSTLLCQG
jgi:hypothetical protein